MPRCWSVLLATMFWVGCRPSPQPATPAAVAPTRAPKSDATATYEAPEPTMPAVGPGVVAKGTPSCVISSVGVAGPPVDLYVRGYRFATAPHGDVRVVLADGEDGARLTVQRSGIRINADIAAEQVRFHARSRHRWRQVIRPLDMKLEAVEHGTLLGSFELPPTIAVDPGIAREMRIPCKDARYAWRARYYDDPDVIDRLFIKRGARVPFRRMPDRDVALTLSGIDGYVAQVYQHFKGSSRVQINFGSAVSGIPTVEVLGWIPKSTLRGPKRSPGRWPGGVPGGIGSGEPWRNRTLTVHVCLEETPLFVRVERHTLQVGRLEVGARIGFAEGAADSNWLKLESFTGDEMLSSYPPVTLIDRAAFVVHETALESCPQTGTLKVP